MLGEDVDQPEEQPSVKSTASATGTPAKDLVAAAAAAAAEAAEADDAFEKAKQEVSPKLHLGSVEGCISGLMALSVSSRPFF